MTTGSGLDGQVGYKLESTVGTAVTVDKFCEFNGEGFTFDPGYIEPTGIRVGTVMKRASRVSQSRNMVSGSLDMDYSTRNMGAFWKAALGSSVTTPGTVTAGQSFSQVHQQGDLLGKSLTVQVGRPEPSTQTVRAHTYSGCKVTSWSWSCADNDIAKFSLNFDGWNEATATALASASFVNSSNFSFSQNSAFSMGGTIGGSNPLTYTSGTPVASLVTSLTLQGNNSLATERFGLSNQGTKKEQLENGIRTITGSFEAEYLQSDFYTAFKANTTTSLNIKFEGAVIGSSTDKDTIEFIIPAIKIKNVTPQVSGPDLVTSTVEFEVYSDGTNNPFQVKLITGDSTAI